MYFEKSIKLCFAMLKREKSAGSHSCAMHKSTKTGIYSTDIEYILLTVDIHSAHGRCSVSSSTVNLRTILLHGQCSVDFSTGL